MNIEELRSRFPILEERVYGKQLVYLDNAATSQRPLEVLEKWNYINTKINSNLHRAVHRLANLATEEFESTRNIVAGFINASSPKEIVFTSGATASLNLIAYSYGSIALQKGDTILISEEEHHSNIVPWQLLANKTGASILVLPVDEEGYMCVEELEPMLVHNRVKILCVSHASNVLGIINPVKEIIRIAHKYDCVVVVDGSQAVIHEKVDVQELDCDFYAFSGHKLYSAPGTGILFGKKELLNLMPPFMGGGEMISTVHWDSSTYAEVPHKFEAGTQNISGVPTMIPAIELVASLRNNYFQDYQKNLIEFVLREIAKRPNIRLYGVPRQNEDKIPLFSITVLNVHHEDLALLLDKMGIAVRSGQMCAEPLMDRYGVTGMLRFSFAPYNTIEEADYFFKSLDKAISMLS